MKKWWISIIVIAVILVLLVAGVGALMYRGYSVSTGIYLEAKNDTAILVCDQTPIVMSNRTQKDLFADLETGDKITVVHDGIQETYPAGTGVYAVFANKDGTTGEIPPSVMDTLTEMGWFE